jgi:hypothetical protein
MRIDGFGRARPVARHPPTPTSTVSLSASRYAVVLSRGAVPRGIAVIADRRALEQVLGNLVDNAINTQLVQVDAVSGRQVARRFSTGLDDGTNPRMLGTTRVSADHRSEGHGACGETVARRCGETTDDLPRFARQFEKLSLSLVASVLFSRSRFRSLLIND